MATKTRINFASPTRFKKLANFLAKALEYKYRFPTSPDYPSTEAAYPGRWSWIKTEQQQGIIPLARQIFKEYGRYYANDNEFVNRFVLGRQRRDPLLERLIQNDHPTEEQDMLAGRAEEEALRKEQPAPILKQTAGTAQTTPTPKIQLPPIPPVIIRKESTPPEQPSAVTSPQMSPSPPPTQSETLIPPERGTNPSATPSTPPLSTTVGIPSPGIPKMPSAVSGFGKDFASNAGIFLKKNVTKYLTFGNMVSGIFTVLGAITGGVLTQGQPVGIIAGAGGGAIGSSYLRSPEGRRSLGNIGAGTISRTVNFSSQFSTQSLIKGPPKKVWLGILVGFLALMSLGAAFPSLPTDEQPPSQTGPQIPTVKEISSCPVLNGRITYASYQADPITGHCTSGSLEDVCPSVCPFESRRSKSIDVDTSGGKDVVLPKIENKDVQWQFIQALCAGGGTYPNCSSAKGGTGGLYTFEGLISGSPDKWYIQFVHMEIPSQLQINNTHASGTIVGKTDVGIVHTTIGKNIKNPYGSGSPETDCDPGWIPADLEMKMCI